MIKYVIGDATHPELHGDNNIKIIVHIVNNIGKWGAGFVLAISKRWQEPENYYKKVFKERELGDIDLIKVEDNIHVCNLFGQFGIRNYKTPNEKPIRYFAVEKGLKELRSIIGERKDIEVHMPKIGCGLAGGNWSIIEDIINKTLTDIPVYVYSI